MKIIGREQIVPLGIAVTLGVLSAGYTAIEDFKSLEESPLHAFERKLLDLKFKIRGRIHVEPKVVIAAGDEKTITSFGRWGTWDRARYARILDNLFAAGAEIAAFDIVFADKVGLDHDATVKLAQLLDDARLSETAGTLAVAVSEGAKATPQDIAQVALRAKAVEDLFNASTQGDKIFAEALDRHSTRVIQGFIAETDPEDGKSARTSYDDETAALDAFVMKGYGFGWKITQSDDAAAAGAEAKVAQLDVKDGAKASDLSAVIAIRGEVLLPQKDFLDVASNVGFFSAYTDPDGVLRRLPLLYRVGDVFYPSLSLATAAGYFGANPGIIADQTFPGGMHSIGFPRDDGTLVDVNTDLNGRLLVNYYGPSGPADPALPDDKRGVFPRVSLADVYENTFDPAIVKGKAVIIAVTAIGTFDQRVTPFSPNVPGAEVHAAALQNMIDGRELRRPTLYVQIEMMLAVLLALIMGLVLPRLTASAGLGAFFGLTIVAVGVNFFVLFPNDMWFHDVPLAIQAVASWAGITVWGYLTTGRDKVRLKKEFSSVLAPAVVQQLLDDPKLAGLGGTEREMTVMFSDIRGFTSMSEKLTPEGLTAFLNEYLTPMTDILIQREGTLDKYMGDAVMAFWGAPIEQKDHAARAALAALDMIEKLEQMKVKWRAEGKPELDIGIGLNSGLMRVGFMGSERMRNYTVLGDNVNLGSRLEGTNKNYGTHIIVSETTYAQAKHVAYGRWLDAVRVKGKREPVNIYELMGKLEAGGLPPAHAKKLVDVFEAALRHYRAKQWNEAEFAFKEALKLRPDDGPSKVYLDRIAHFREEPPPENWDGVYEFKTK